MWLEAVSLRARLGPQRQLMLGCAGLSVRWASCALRRSCMRGLSRSRQDATSVRGLVEEPVACVCRGKAKMHRHIRVV